jgi:N-acetyl-gamma-glutamyl-phosphate reductase
MAKIRTGIAGGAGYTGGELIRILINHPGAEIRFVQSKSNAGKKIHSVHADLTGETEMDFTASLQEDIDLLFLCLGHGEAKKFLEENTVASHIRIIDLSQDFRLKQQGQEPVINHQPVTYGLPELQRDRIRKAFHIANPGCFATAIQLGLLPLAQEGLLKEVFTTGITGSTGAGQSLSPTGHFSWRANNIQAYKTLTHQHLGEIHQSLHQLQGSFPLTAHDGASGIRFVPWRGDFTRGIFISSQLSCNRPLKDLVELYRAFYQDHPFVTLSETPISMKQVVNTNKVLIQLEQSGNQLVVHSALDNLVKGASGQAVQNMNLLFGLDECAGLKLKSIAF